MNVRFLRSTTMRCASHVAASARAASMLGAPKRSASPFRARCDLRCTRQLDGQVGMLTVHLRPLFGSACLWIISGAGADGALAVIELEDRNARLREWSRAHFVGSACGRGGSSAMTDSSGCWGSLLPVQLRSAEIGRLRKLWSGGGSSAACRVRGGLSRRALGGLLPCLWEAWVDGDRVGQPNDRGEALSCEARGSRGSAWPGGGRGGR